MRLGALCGLFPAYQSLQHGGAYLDDKIKMGDLKMKSGGVIDINITLPEGSSLSPYESVLAWQPEWRTGDDGPSSDDFRFIRKVQLDPSDQSRPYIINIAKMCHDDIMELARRFPDLTLEEYLERVWQKCRKRVQVENAVAVFVYARKLTPHAEIDGKLQFIVEGFPGDFGPTVSIALNA